MTFLRRLLYYPLLAYFVGGAIVANLASLAIATAGAPGRERDLRCRKLLGSMMSLFLRLCVASGFRVVDETGGALKGLRGAVIVANHPSLIDAPALFARDENLVCFYKAGLRRSMLGLPCARYSGFIPNDAGIGGLLEAARRLAEGDNVLVFPEATRTRRGSLLDPFKRSAALLAMRAHAPVVCLVHDYEAPFLGKSSRIFLPPRLPIKLRIRHVATLRPEDFADAEALNEAMREHIRKALEA